MFKFIFSVFLFCQSALGAESPHSKAIEAEKRGDLKQALKFYKEDLALNPHNALSLAVIAGLSGLLGDFQSEEGQGSLVEAQSDYARCLKIESNHVDCLF